MKIEKKIIIELLFAFLFFLIFSFFINRALVIKGLFMDDLYHWSWFPGLSLYEFAFKFYEGASRYRPFFEAIQYLVYIIVGTNPLRFSIINKIYNAFVALFIYFFIRRINVSKFVSFILSTLFLLMHFAYYQIGQSIGTLETDAMFFSLILLYNALRISNVIVDDDKNKTKNIVTIFVIYFILGFTHERFLGMALVVILSLVFMKSEKTNHIYTSIKFISFIIFGIELILMMLLRMLALGKLLPMGTGGTSVEETFDILTCVKFCFQQVLFILGINVGPEHLVGIEFFSIENAKIKFITLCSIALIILIVAFYVVKRINEYKDNYRNLVAGDLLFLSFIAACIVPSSVSIRIEMRFIYVGFVGAILYLAYMYSVILERETKDLIRFIAFIVVIGLSFTRVPVELTYRNALNKVHCIVDQNRMNSLYDNTIGAFGVDDILKNKKVYIVGNNFGMTKFYCEYYYKIYDKTGFGNTISIIDSSDIDNIKDNKDAIILTEDFINNKYIRIN